MADSVKFVKEFCRRIPKVELHAHLNGSISMTTMNKLLKKRLQKDSDCGLLSGWQGDKEFTKENFSKGFEVFSAIHKLVDNKEAVKLVTEDVIKEFAEDNVKYLELRSTPKANPAKGITKKCYLDAIMAAIEEAKKTLPEIIVRFLVSIDRKRGVEEAMENVRLALEYHDKTGGLVCGVDLSGDPLACDSSVFIPSLKKAKDQGLKLSLHTAEIPNVEDALILLQVPPDRIGHGTCLHPDQGGSEELMDLVKQQGIPLELCLTSNLKCHSVSSYDEHHMWYWYNERHPFILATDDKGVFSTTLSEEYEIMMNTMKLTPRQVWDMSYRAIDYVFADEVVKTHLRDIWNSTEQDVLAA